MFRHPEKVCKRYNENKCELGGQCEDKHPKKIAHTGHEVRAKKEKNAHENMKSLHTKPM